MYNETYDDYIRNILGYPQNNNIYNSSFEDYSIQNNDFANNTINMRQTQNAELEKYYPEIYKIVYPMVLKKCDNVRSNITKNEIDNMTDEIYNAVEEKNEIELNINLTNDVRTVPVSNRMNQNNNERRTETTIKEDNNKRQRPINRGLRDLIRILLIRELLNRPGVFPPFPPRPPMPGPGPRPPRPPMRPPFGPGRIPFNRDFTSSNYDIYEN